MSNDKYKMFKDFMYNDLGISKEDIQNWIKEVIKEVAWEYIEHHFSELNITSGEIIMKDFREETMEIAETRGIRKEVL